MRKVELNLILPPCLFIPQMLAGQGAGEVRGMGVFQSNVRGLHGYYKGANNKQTCGALTINS